MSDDHLLKLFGWYGPIAAFKMYGNRNQGIITYVDHDHAVKAFVENAGVLSVVIAVMTGRDVLNSGMGLRIDFVKNADKPATPHYGKKLT